MDNKNSAFDQIEAQQSGFDLERTSSEVTELSSHARGKRVDTKLVRTNINWIVRIKNKVFWLSIVPAVLLLIQTVCALCGIELEIAELQTRLPDIVNAVFAVLVILGVVADPTTAGVGDSQRALSYERPWMDADIAEEPNVNGSSAKEDEHNDA